MQIIRECVTCMWVNLKGGVFKTINDSYSMYEYVYRYEYSSDRKMLEIR